MHSTTINITFTKITYFDSTDQTAKFIHVPEKLTVKQCKEHLQDGQKFITKEIETDSFDLPTELLLSLKEEQQN